MGRKEEINHEIKMFHDLGIEVDLDMDESEVGNQEDPSNSEVKKKEVDDE